MKSRFLFLLLAMGCILGVPPREGRAQNSAPSGAELPNLPAGDPTSEIDEDLQHFRATEDGVGTNRAKRAASAAAFAVGGQLEQQGQWEQALLRYRESARDDPHYVPVLARVGLVLLKLQRPAEALAWTQSAAGRHPDSAALMALLAVIHGELQEYEPAERWARRSLGADPHLISNYATLSKLAVIQGRPERVRQYFASSLKIESNEATFYARLASLWIQVLPSDGKTLPSQAAREVGPLLQKAAQRDPDNLALTLALGQAAFMGGEYSGAAGYYEKVAQKRPEYPLLQQRLAECYLRLGKNAEALKSLEWLLERNPAQKNLLPLVAELHGKLEQWSQAVEFYQRALQLDPNNPKILFACAEAQLKADDLDASLRTVDQAMTQFPGLSAFPYLRGILLFLKKDYTNSFQSYEKAENLALGGQEGLLNRDFYFRKALSAEKAGYPLVMENALLRCIELDPKDHEALNFLGYALAEKGQRLDQAEPMIRRAVELDPTNAAYLDSLGWVYYQQGDYKRARAYLARAVQLMPGDSILHEHLGDAWHKLGYRKEAVAEWTKALEKSENPEALRKKIASP